MSRVWQGAVVERGGLPTAGSKEPRGRARSNSQTHGVATSSTCADVRRKRPIAPRHCSTTPAVGILWLSYCAAWEFPCSAGGHALLPNPPICTTCPVYGILLSTRIDYLLRFGE